MPEIKNLTKKQEEIVWNHICENMDFREDRDPNDVIEKDYRGDRHRYLKDMAAWHGIKF